MTQSVELNIFRLASVTGKLIYKFILCRVTGRTLQHISGETHFCAVFNILILTIGSGSHGCAEVQSPHMADQAPRRKLSTSLAVTCIQTSFYIHAMSLFVQLTCHLTTTAVMSDTPAHYISSVSGKR